MIRPDQHSPAGAEVQALVDHFFRHQSAQVIATLSRAIGFEHLDLIEDAVQETLLSALRQWPLKGIPANPAGWILISARNKTLDQLRRVQNFSRKEAQIVEELQRLPLAESEPGFTHELTDDLLRMMFACCHPALGRDSQVPLTLSALCGFSVTEIARAFLAPEPTIAQRLVRAKRKIREEKISLEVPTADDLVQRREVILEVLYFLFNEGYSAHGGEELIREDLCAEAIRLGEILARHPAGQSPSTYALLALMYVQAARLPARVDTNNELLLLKNQDRNKWDREAIARGFKYLEQSAQGNTLTEYHLQAGIASCHAAAESYEATDWAQIVEYYDQLLLVNASPVIALNRAVALAMHSGAEAGLTALAEIETDRKISQYHLYHATKAELLRRSGQADRARFHYTRAIELVGSEAERRFLEKRLAEL